MKTKVTACRDQYGFSRQNDPEGSLMTSKMRPPECLLLSRPGCHLCDEADAILRRYGLTPKIVNIDEDQELAGRYTNCVPVVFLNGKRRFTGKVDERLLVRLLPRPS